MYAVKSELDCRISNEEMIAVELKSNLKMIGNVYLGKRDCNSLEFGYLFKRKFWVQGYAEEACNTLIKRSFSYRVHRIYAECDPCNTASYKLLEKLGFTREAHFRKMCFSGKMKIIT